MALKLKKINTMTITTKDEAFAESSYVGEDLKFTVKPLTRTKLQQFNKACSRMVKGEEVLDSDKFSKKIFDYIYVSSNGTLELEDGNGEILEDGTEDFKTLLFEEFSELGGCLVTAALKYEEKCRVDDDSIKN